MKNKLTLVKSSVPCEFCKETGLELTERKLKKGDNQTYKYTVKCMGCGVALNGNDVQSLIKEWEKYNDKGENKQEDTI